MRSLFLIPAVLAASIAAPAAPARADDAAHYVQKLIADMVAISKLPTRDRRAFYEDFLANEIDWNGPALHALGDRWSALSDPDRRKLAEWARNSVLGHDGVMQFVQNMVFRSCAITGKNLAADTSSVRIKCLRVANDPDFIVRFEIERQGQALRIADVGYVGISLREALGKEILKADAVKEHGVQVSGIASK